MKKLLFLFLSLIFSITCTNADVMPFYVSSIPHPGLGVVNVPDETIIYKEPKENSPIITTVSYDVNGAIMDNARYQVNRIFIAFSPRSYLAFATVFDENGENWYQICYDQFENKKGWINVTDRKQFFVWKDFYDYYGRKYGIYAFRDIPPKFKQLYGGPGDDSQVIQSYEYARFIKLNKVTGNWILVTLTDLRNMSKIGWVRWRSPEGKMYYFPSIQKTF